MNPVVKKTHTTLFDLWRSDKTFQQSFQSVVHFTDGNISTHELSHRMYQFQHQLLILTLDFRQQPGESTEVQRTRLHLAIKRLVWITERFFSFVNTLYLLYDPEAQILRYGRKIDSLLQEKFKHARSAERLLNLVDAPHRKALEETYRRCNSGVAYHAMHHAKMRRLLGTVEFPGLSMLFIYGLPNRVHPLYDQMTYNSYAIRLQPKGVLPGLVIAQNILVNMQELVCSMTDYRGYYSQVARFVAMRERLYEDAKSNALIRSIGQLIDSAVQHSDFPPGTFRFIIVIPIYPKLIYNINMMGIPNRGNQKEILGVFRERRRLYRKWRIPFEIQLILHRHIERGFPIVYQKLHTITVGK